METPTVTRRRLQARWVERHFRELTADEQQLIRNALGDIPGEPSCGTQDEFWKRAQAGEVGLWVCRDEAEQIALVTFYVVEKFGDGSLNFVSCGTVTVGGAGERNITASDMPQMEALARRLGCHSMSLRTIRPGLVKRITEQHGWYLSEVILRKIL